MGREQRIAVLLSTVVFATIGGGVLVDALTARPAVAAELPAFDSCASLRTWVDRAASDEAKHPQYLPGIGYGAVTDGAGIAGSAPGVPMPMSASASVAGEAASAGSMRGPVTSTKDAVGTSATGTNVQEAGVDEPDQVKTDGHYVVGVQAENHSVWIATLAGHTPHVIGRLRLDGTPTSLLLAGNRALVTLQQQIAYPAAEPARGGVSSSAGVSSPCSTSHRQRSRCSARLAPTSRTSTSPPQPGTSG
jgi:hypothetical protein